MSDGCITKIRLKLGTQDGNLISLLMRRNQNGHFNVWNLDGFSLVWVLMYQQSKSAFFYWLKILNWSKWILVIDIFNEILLMFLTFIALQILWKVSICCLKFLFGECYYVKIQFTPWRVIDIFDYGQNLSWNVY